MEREEELNPGIENLRPEDAEPGHGRDGAGDDGVAPFHEAPDAEPVEDRLRERGEAEG